MAFFLSNNSTHELSIFQKSYYSTDTYKCIVQARIKANRSMSLIIKKHSILSI